MSTQGTGRGRRALRQTLSGAALVWLTVAATPPLAAQDSAWPRRVVLTNDDGIEAEGLAALVDAFAPVAEVFVVAPRDNRSGSTNYVSAIAVRRLTAERRHLREGVVAYAVDGYPADAVVFALSALLAERPPDLVISGVNDGPNLSDDWNLSGTVGAARMAAFLGVPGIAVSGFSSEHPETLEMIGRWTVALARTRLVRELGPGQYLTVSVPRVAAAEVAGVEIVRRGPRPWAFEFERADGGAPDGAETWTLRFARREVDPPAGTDLHAYAANRIAIVPMRVDEHDQPRLRALGAGAPEIPAWPPGTGNPPR